MQAILSISVSPSDDALLAGSSNCVAYLWNINGKLKHVMTGHCGKITGVGFLRNNHEGITGSEDKTMKIWDLDKGFCLRTISTPSIIYSLTVNPDNMIIISGHKDGAVRLFKSNSNKMINCIANLRSSVTCCSLSKCTNFLSLTSRDNAIVIYDLRMNQQL